jgi:hypothetical protein
MARDMDLPVDAVYTWVDVNDPKWQERMCLARETPGTDAGMQPHPAQPVSRTTTYQNDDLKYSLRSLSACLPWIRRVFIITDEQCPAWLDREHVTIVDHKEIFPEYAKLPTFNSHSIEICQHRIDGLAECFMSFNDDFIIRKKIPKNYFFTEHAEPIIWAAKFRAKHKARLLSEDYDEMSPHAAGDVRARQMILKQYGDYMPFRIRHYPRSMTRSIMEEIWRVFPEEVRNTVSSQFRSVTDISIHALFPYFSVSRGLGKFRRINGIRQIADALSGELRHIGATIGNENFHQKLRLIKTLKPLTLCLNDGGSASNACRDTARSFLDSLYPHRSKFEKP